jgi:hypothetical protein
MQGAFAAVKGALLQLVTAALTKQSSYGKNTLAFLNGL